MNTYIAEDVTGMLRVLEEWLKKRVSSYQLTL